MKAGRFMRILTVLLGMAVLLTACRGMEPQTASDSSERTEATEFPEEIQNTGSIVVGLEDLPVYEYEQREIKVMNNGQRIYGIAYIPNTGAETVPLVICAHGLGGSYRDNLAYAEQLASHGLATYCFDFRGGGGSRSDGSTTEMSVMTEVSDLEVILDAAREWDFADPQRIVLLGTSQGGITSAIAAARRADDVAGAILMYPAFVVHDDIHKRFSSLDEVPEVFQFNWITAGRPYVEDMWDYDVYTEIGNYKDKVLLMHGSADGIVPVSYSDRAAEVYQDAEYYVINGAGHGFSGSAFEEAVGHIFDYLQEIGVISAAQENSAETDEVPEIKIIPESYNSAAEHQGTVEAFEYTSGGSTKTTYVYLPYAMTGSEDIAYNAMSNQINAMHNAPQFTFGLLSAGGNIQFDVLDGGTHDYTYYRNYIYSILPYFFGG